MNSLLPGGPVVPQTAHTPVVAPGSSADPTTVTPVVPASHQAAPAAALDKVAAEPGVFQKALGLAQPYIAKVDAVTHPYVEKVQQTTKPYTDAALTKAKELIEKVEGQAPAAAGTPTAAAAQGGDGATSVGATSTELRGPGVPPVTAGFAGGSSTSTLVDHSGPTSATGTSTTAGSAHPQTLEERLDGVFASLSRRASVVTAKIDEKTATPDKPGWASQLASAVQKVTDKADAYIQGHAPTATNGTSTIGHPVQTTTNSVPHTDKPATTSGATTAPGPPVGAGVGMVVPVVVPVVPLQ